MIVVDIRSWFAKEIETEIPVFKVLSGGTVAQLLEYALENMPAKLTPNQTGEASTTSEQGESARAQLTPDSHSSVPSITLTNDSTGTSQTGDDNDKSVGAATSQLDDGHDKTEPLIAPPLSNNVSTDFEKIIPISPGQSRFWFLKQLMEDQTTANSTISVSIEGTIRLDSLGDAVRQVAARYEAFRTSFLTDEDQKPVQAISGTSRLYLERNVIADEFQDRRGV